ncbi:hypothetical protein IHE44_0001438 [Lamprotornis superbus]|uniref:CDK2-associated and cullin domain-containing protein 1 n=57 Tax=Passeriformes TaxID=9126 RepID=A0A835TSD2_9PASS|nr:hypothetical protein IHE44_0001438 [Lamprotornis superbus]
MGSSHLSMSRDDQKLKVQASGFLLFGDANRVMNVITIEDYKSTYWPKLDSAIDQLLTQSPGDYIPISYEQIYSCVYKCVCQQHSEQMYSDLIKKITNHLERVSKELQASPPDLYIERFNVALGQYMGALQSIVPLFIYMNKFYIETKLNRDLKDDLIKLFTEHVAEKHIYNLMPLLLEAQSTPFQITPSTMANIVKGLYTLRPEWVQMAPALFSKFIPNILPPAVESELQEYAAQDQKLQRELIQNGFTRWLISLCKLQGIQIVNILDQLLFLARADTGGAQVCTVTSPSLPCSQGCKLDGKTGWQRHLVKTIRRKEMGSDCICLFVSLPSRSLGCDMSDSLGSLTDSKRRKDACQKKCHVVIRGLGKNLYVNGSVIPQLLQL